jgi:O-acetyl-ADP-ribose deacetylase (regulator of RNase III)
MPRLVLYAGDVLDIDTDVIVNAAGRSRPAHPVKCV